MERVELVQGVKKKSTKTVKTPIEGLKKTKAATIGKSKNSNLRIHHAYVHSSLFKDYASVNPLPLSEDKWKIEVNFKNNKSVTPVVESTNEMKKVVKKVLDLQKKYGVKDIIPTEVEEEEGIADLEANEESGDEEGEETDIETNEESESPPLMVSKPTVKSSPAKETKTSSTSTSQPVEKKARNNVADKGKSETVNN